MFLEDMLDGCERIRRYTEGLDYERFLLEDVIFDAVVRRLSVIGEAATRIPYEVRSRYPGIGWRKIVGLRNIMVHQYASVDEEILSDIVVNNVPRLREELLRMPETEEPGNQRGPCDRVALHLRPYLAESGGGAAAC